MELEIIGSGSSGNSYLLTSSIGERLIIEAGVNFKEIKKALKFNYINASCLVTHQHTDHSKAANDVCKAGINLYCLPSTASAAGLKSHRVKFIEPNREFIINSFKILPFSVKHDVECLGFLIFHNECGRVLFITDSYMVTQRFRGLNNIIIEANYSDEILDEMINSGKIEKWRKDRLVQSHMSLKTCKGVLEANDLSEVYKIVLIHLSASNSNAEQFKKEVEELTQKKVIVASKGLKIDFNITPF